MKKTQILAERTLSGSAAVLSGACCATLAKKAKENFKKGNKFCGAVDVTFAVASGLVSVVNAVTLFEKKK